jgi:serine phosphatase RsbU (regulator of sigma subunit)
VSRLPWTGEQTVTKPADPLERPVGRLLRVAQVADPQLIVETLSMSVAELGGTDVVLFLMDFDHTRLKPHPHVLPHGEQPSIASVDGSMAGRVFTSGQPLAAQHGDEWRVWVPVSERAQRLGVLAMTLPDWDSESEEFCVELGIAAGFLVATADRYTDRLTLLRRRKDMSLAAEMQWSLLPPLTFTIDVTTVAGLLEPAYEVGGDCFDYSLNGDVLDLAVFDAMGHGLRSAVLASLAISAYRHSRRLRAARDLAALIADIDRAVAEHGRGEQFVTALVAQLDITTGRLTWASAGHPEPLHVRRASTLPALGGTPTLPLGLGAVLSEPRAVEMMETSLEPGDALLFYTDGVVEARDAHGDEFGEDRLRDLLEREASSGREPPEVLRRLVHSVLAHVGEKLRDDASTLYLRWDGPTATRR